MFRKSLQLVLALVMAASLLAAISGVPLEQPRWIGAQRISGTHLVPPRDVEQVLVDEGMISINATPAEKLAALQAFEARWQKQSDTWVNAQVEARARARESGRVRSMTTIKPPKVVKVSVKILALAVDFSEAPQTVTFEYVNDEGECVIGEDVFDGPRQGQIPPPVSPDPSNPTAPYDNNTVWYTPEQTANPKFYENIIFGYKGAGRVRMDLIDPRDGKPGINLKGVTVQDYYDHMAGAGNVKLSGTVKGWITVDHPEAYYGADTCQGGHSGGAYDADGNRVPGAQLVEDTVMKFNAANPSYYTDTSKNAFWKQFDQNKDGYVDTFWLIYAGMGQEAGGGVEGDFALWSHSSDLRNYSKWAPLGLKVYEGNPATPDDDIYVGPYTMQPENAEVGVFAEEFGHNVFGLPDLYTTDAQGSIGFWSIMEAGAWGGYLGGSQPVGMPLWFRMIADCGGVSCNWAEPLARRAYNDPAQLIPVVRLDDSPGGNYYKGVRIDLPPIVEAVDNPVGTGNAAYTDKGRDQVDLTLDLEVAIPEGAPGILSVPSYWDIEEDWDYGYVLVKEGDGDWAMLPDMDGIFRTSNPNGNNRGVGLTGAGEGALRFDLSAYAGKTVTLRLEYVTDAAVTYNGWFVDDLTLDGNLISDFDTVAPFNDWVNSDPGWIIVPVERHFANYYLVEWRDNGKYDGMTRTAYVTTDNEENLWRVERVPYNVPAALVYYRNTKYTNTYALRPNHSDPPSYGPKYQLLIVDMNELPIRLFAGDPVAANYLAALNSRASSYDAGLTLQDVEGFTLSKVWGLSVPGPFVVPAKPAITLFDDRYGHYAGLYYGQPCPAGRLCFANRDGSAVIPAAGPYSTRITDFYGNPLPALYGLDVGLGSLLGSGNPVDDGVQWGVMIKLVDKKADGSRAKIAVGNSFNLPK